MRNILQIVAPNDLPFMVEGRASSTMRVVEFNVVISLTDCRSGKLRNAIQERSEICHLYRMSRQSA